MRIPIRAGPLPDGQDASPDDVPATVVRCNGSSVDLTVALEPTQSSRRGQRVTGPPQPQLAQFEGDQ